MTTSFSLEDYLTASKTIIDEALAKTLTEEDPTEVLVEAMRYSLLGSGKRLRPILCIASAETFGIPPNQSLPAAIAIELLHCYSLIHDDLPALDDDRLRRGRLTSHMVYGEATALLAGDALLTYAFEQLSQPSLTHPTRQLQMVHWLARAAGPYGMVGGQQADVLAEGEAGTLAQLQFIHSHKTARLIQASVVIGGLFAELSNQELQALETYGEEIGLAFQMMDDWLDVVGDAGELGKESGRDESLDKLTFPKLVGVDMTLDLARRHVDAACNALSGAEIDAPVLLALARYVTERRH